jgi:AcrR family transcriptional regulator
VSRAAQTAPPTGHPGRWRFGESSPAPRVGGPGGVGGTPPGPWGERRDWADGSNYYRCGAAPSRDNGGVSNDSAPGRRRTPSQERSRETVEAICAAASAIIQEDGIAALTTNAVAKRAGVSITAVYAYFEDKWSIVHELFERFERLRAKALEGFYADFAAAEHWAPCIDRTWDRMARFRAEVPGGAALRAATYSNPRLAELDFQGSVRSAETFAEAMCTRRPSLARDVAYRASWTISLTAGVLLDDAVRDGTVDWERLAEGKRLIKSYLATYLDVEP